MRRFMVRLFLIAVLPVSAAVTIGTTSSSGHHAVAGFLPPFESVFTAH